MLIQTFVYAQLSKISFFGETVDKLTLLGCFCHLRFVSPPEVILTCDGMFLLFRLGKNVSCLCPDDFYRSRR